MWLQAEAVEGKRGGGGGHRKKSEKREESDCKLLGWFSPPMKICLQSDSYSMSHRILGLLILDL